MTHDLGDAAERRQRQLDLGGVDVLAAGDEHVLLAIDDVVVALVVAAHEVAGVEEARAAERLARSPRALPEVAERDHRAAERELADLARRDRSGPASSTILRLEVEVGPADRAGLAERVLGREREAVGADLGEAVALAEEQPRSR